MDRYTRKNKSGYFLDAFLHMSGECDKLNRAVNRLGEYEDTGLMPEDILTGVQLAEIACMQIRYKKIQELLERAAEEIENLYGRETELSKLIREQMN